MHDTKQYCAECEIFHNDNCSKVCKVDVPRYYEQKGVFNDKIENIITFYVSCTDLLERWI